MFTGLVQAVGRIEQVERRERGLRLVVQAAPIDSSSLKVGDSVAVNGCCLTAMKVEGTRFQVDVSEQTLTTTANLDRCGDVNLELSLALGERIGGHLMYGHVDAVGTVMSVSAVGESSELVVRAPRSLAAYLAYKGSLAVDGVSLTINRVQDSNAACDVWINLIPHTRAVTTLGQLAIGQSVNLEADPLARYAERIASVLTPAHDKRT
jgi:riboflavin synthase